MLHLVRHGETLSYDDDAGLTELGLRQAEHRGRALSSLVRDGARIGVVYAPTERARSTAGQVSHALLTAATESGKRVEMAAGYPDEGFGNVSLWVDGKAMEPTQTRRLHLALVETGGPEPGWVTEASRFWAAHTATGDAMTFWLTTPLLWHEPPGAVVYRILQAARRHAEAAVRPDHLLVATHSGCMRALVTWAAGVDLGEPENAEDVTLQVDGDLGSVEFRQNHWQVRFPTEPPPPWFQPVRTPAGQPPS